MQRIHFKKRRFAKLLRILQPQIQIGGIDISDESLAFLNILEKTGKWQSATVRLAQGVIEKGIVQKPAELKKSLRELRQKMGIKKGKTIPLVVSISDENVYTQRFSLPPLKFSEFGEAVKLNLRTMAPSDPATMYYDWEGVEKNYEQEGEDREVLASFIEKKKIEGITRSFAEEHFFVTAVEQKAASLARTISQFETSFSADKSYLLIMDTSDGVTFVILRRGTVYFARFSGWEDIGKDIQGFVTREYHQIYNFFTNKFHEQFECVYLALQSSLEEIRTAITSLVSIPIREVRIQGKQVDASWFIAIGAALRGRIPRAQDTQISLAPEDTETLYEQMRTSSFLSLWTGIFSAAMFIIVGSFLGAFLFLNQYIETNVSNITASFNDPNVLAQYNFYTQESEKFNANLARVLEIRNRQVRWSGFLKAVYQAAGSQVSISRIYIQAADMPVSITGSVPSESVANSFKERLEALPYVTDADLPLSGFQKVDATHISYKLTLKFKNLDF